MPHSRLLLIRRKAGQENRCFIHGATRTHPHPVGIRSLCAVGDSLTQNLERQVLDRLCNSCESLR